MPRSQPARASKKPASQEKRPSTKTILGKMDQSTKRPSAANHCGGTQVQLQRSPDTVSKEITKADTLASQEVSVEKSLEITQTLLQGCVSLLASMRNMFRLDCYENKYYIFGEAPQGAPNQAPPGKFFAGLKKGVCHRVDRLINLLELGITDALRQGFLDSLHFMIYEDPKDPSNILEQWIFTFSYHTDVTRGARIAPDMELTEKKHGSKITVGHAKYALVKFIQQLAHICSVLPELPEVKYMTVDIWYTENRPPEYKAPGFSRPVLGISRALETGEWEKTVTPIPDRMNTGHHGVSLRLIHLLDRPNDFNGTGKPCLVNCVETGQEFSESVGPVSSEISSWTLPSLEKCSKLQSTQQCQAPKSLRSCSTKKSNATEMPPPSSRRLSGVNHDDVSNLGQVAIPDLQHHRHSLVDASKMHQVDAITDTTQSPIEDMQVRDQLRHMLQPRSGYADTQATQVLTDSTLRPYGEEHTVVRMQFSQATIDKLDSVRSAHLARRKDTSLIRKEPNASIVEGRVDTVKCQCGSIDIDVDMLHCGFCNSLQHIVCYGFIDRHDEQIPCVHICYACLLHGERALLGQLTYHALCRRALYMLQKQSFDSEKQLAQAIGCSMRDCMNIVRRFRQEGLLGGSRKAKQVMLNRSSESRAKIAMTYFEPTYRIDHHLGSSEDSATTPFSASIKRTRDIEDKADNVEVKRAKVGNRVTEDFDLGGWWSPNPGKEV